MIERRQNGERSLAGTLVFLGQDAGTALVEFALVLPVILLLFVGSYQLLDAIAAYRKVTATVRTLTDLTAQSSSLTPAQADTILAVSRQVMAPYAITPAALRISQVQVSDKGVPSVVWSRGLNATAYSGGDYINIPTNMRIPNSYLVYGEITYRYVPIIASSMLGPISYSDRLFMSPRNSDSIPFGTG